MAILQQPSFKLGNKITKEQLDFFQKYGLLQFRNFVDRATVAVFLDEINRVQKELLEKQTTKVNGIPLRFGTDVNGEKIIQRLAFTSQYSTILSDFLKDERLKALIDLLQPYDGRIGEDEKDGLVVNHYINTAESEYKQLGWHTDSPRDIFLGSRIMPMLNVGLHLDDCPFENGGLRVLAGTHNQGMFTLLFKKKYFIDNNPDPKEIGLDVEAGDLTVHDGRLWHRVQKSPHLGEKSRRRVMYIPIVTGSYHPKNDKSPTPFYHKIAKFVLRNYKKDMEKAP